MRQRKSDWFFDQTYRRKLSDEDKIWLDRFNQEYHKGNFKGETLHPKYYKTECIQRAYRQRYDALKGAIYVDHTQISNEDVE